jgi:hypothetical protein
MLKATVIWDFTECFLHRECCVPDAQAADSQIVLGLRFVTCAMMEAIPLHLLLHAHFALLENHSDLGIVKIALLENIAKMVLNVVLACLDILATRIRLPVKHAILADTQSEIPQFVRNAMKVGIAFRTALIVTHVLSENMFLLCTLVWIAHLDIFLQEIQRIALTVKRESISQEEIRDVCSAALESLVLTEESTFVQIVKMEPFPWKDIPLVEIVLLENSALEEARFVKIVLLDISVINSPH